MIFRITFYKTVFDSTGHPHRVEQGVIRVNNPSRTRAILEAQRRFAQNHPVRKWDFYADEFSVGIEPAHNILSSPPDSITAAMTI